MDCHNLGHPIVHMCFERFLLAFESRNLSQADKSVFFPKLKFLNDRLQLYPQKAIWHFGKIVLVKLSLKSFQAEKVNSFLSFFW